MPKRRTKKRSRRGGSLMDWARKGHSYARKTNLYSNSLGTAYDKYGKNQVGKRLSKSNAALVNKGVQMALAKLKQSGYGRAGSSCGSGLRLAGNGLRLAGSGNRMKY